MKEGGVVDIKDLTRYEQVDGGEEGVVGRLTKTKDYAKGLWKTSS